MKSYGELCAVARALDIVGERWTLLIVRELLIRGQARFTDLQRGLPGVASNLLAQRLRDLEDHGVLFRDAAPPPVAGSIYRLTERGLALDGVIRELLKWGAPTIPDAPKKASFQMHWLSMPARHVLHDGRPDEPPVTIRFGDVRDGFDLTAAGGDIEVAPCDPAQTPATTIAGPGPALVGLIQGAIPLARASEEGIEIIGDPGALARVLPRGQ